MSTEPTLRKIEITFPAAVSVPAGFLQRLSDLVSVVCTQYEVEHPDRVMWAFGQGSKIVGGIHNIIDDGPIPFDHSTYVIECAERERYGSDGTAPTSVNLEEVLYLPALRGLRSQQEPKYTTDGNNLVNRVTGQAIPDDEPVFIFRGKDKRAQDALEHYRSIVSDAHKKVVDSRIKDFYEFAEKYPERMKEPDSRIPHRWGRDGEKCLVCGDKDWMGTSFCFDSNEKPAAHTLPEN